MLVNTEKIYQYCENHSGPLDDILEQLERETNLKTLAPRMLSGILQGKILKMISQMQNPDMILEIGTFTGYSAICLAAGLKENGKLITIDNTSEYRYISDSYFEKSGFQHKISQIIGNAHEVIPTLDYHWDLVFIDADKEAYGLYFDLVIENLKSGGIILADNILWSEKVVEELKDKKTKAIDDFNKKISTDRRVENVILPIRDGINLIRKK
ncbi:MAG: class I SAM-dependent methyltransferase [Saprospiraceae bacterium]|nr:class I SAM-dependent methyltransferase [Saprospiraceae bacterium]